MVKKHLGRGLRALIPEPIKIERAGDSSFSEIPINRIVRNPLQPRENISPEGIEALRQSIEEQGVLQPIVVQPAKDGYELVAGERRWKAAKAAGLEIIPARIILDRTAVELLEISLVENVQREDLNPIDIARGYNWLAAEFKLTHQDIARRVGADRSTVTNMLRLLQLPKPVQDSIRNGEISMGHARALLSLPNEKEQLDALKEIKSKGMSVRQTEALGSKKRKKASPTDAAQKIDPAIKTIEDRLQHHFGTKVQVQKKKKEGIIKIHFYSDEEFERILELLELIDNIDN